MVNAGGIMYAVIRTGGKQYRVAPGDVVKVESLTPGDGGSIEFNDVLAFSGDSGSLVKPQSGKVLGTVVSEGRGDKILVFHFKRKKQYKKLQGHRQGFTQIRISEIHIDGNRYTA
jgi:large subunit ribosomal protein L21